VFQSTEALLFRYRGELGEAVQRLRALQAEARETGDLQSLAAVDQFLGEALLELGEDREATAALQEALDLGDRGLRPDGSVPPRCALSVACSHRGAIAEARGLLSEAREKAASIGDCAWNEVRLRSAEAHLAVAESNWPAAWSAFADSADGWARMGMRWHRARTLQEWAEAHAAHGEPGDQERAVELLREALAAFEEMGSPGYAAAAQQRLEELEVE
jgi:tetratricopeptide (TPR) repeat protein